MLAVLIRVVIVIRQLRMKNKTLLSSCVLFVIMLIGCSQKDEVKTIVCDTNNAIEINPFKSGLFKEVILSPSPLSMPKHVEIMRDGGIYFHAGDTLFRYSLLDGRKKMVYGQRGRAKNEYIRLWEYWMDGEDLCLYDLDTRRILCFSKEGVLKDIKEMVEGMNPFQFLCRLDSNHWIGRMTFRGKQVETPELGLFDNDYQLIHPIGEGKLLSGMRVGYHFSNNPEGVLFIGPLSDKILQVNENESYIKYRVEFSDGIMNLENYSDEFEMLEDIMKELDRRDFSFSVTGLREDGGYLGFAYQSSRKKAMYALYDKKTEKTVCFNIILPEDWQICDSVLLDGNVYFVGFGNDAGTRIWTASVTDLLSMSRK